MNKKLGYIICAYLSLFCYGVIDNSRGPAFPDVLNFFNLSLSKGSLFFAGSALAAIPAIALARWWLDAWGELRAQRLFLAFLCVGALGIGLSGFIEHGFLLLIIASLIFGLGIGGTNVATNMLVAFGSSEKNSRRLYSGLHSMYGVSSILAPLLYSVAALGGFDWRHLFIALAGLPLVTILLSTRASQIRHETSISQKPKDLSRLRGLAIGFVLSFYAACEVGISSRLVFFADRTLNLSAADASIYLSVFFILLFAGRFIFSVIRFKSSAFRLMLISSSISLVLILLGVLIHPLFLAVSALTMSYYFPCGVDWVSKRFGDSMGYVMTSIMLSVQIVLMLMHWTIGFVSDNLGIRTGMAIPAVFMAATIMLLISLRREFELPGEKMKLTTANSDVELGI